MKVIKQSHEILTDRVLIREIPKMIELAGRTCYKSEDKITGDSADAFCQKLIKHGHEAMIEHGVVTVRFITNRGVTHELVRHRVASFAQESTRYVKYADVEFIAPVFDWYKDKLDVMDIGSHKMRIWQQAMSVSETAYRALIDQGCPAQEAREVLPNSLKTEIIVTANIREWRHIFKLRCAKGAHPQIRELMIPVLGEFAKLMPALFIDLVREI